MQLNWSILSEKYSRSLVKLRQEQFHCAYLNCLVVNKWNRFLKHYWNIKHSWYKFWKKRVFNIQGFLTDIAKQSF